MTLKEGQLVITQLNESWQSTKYWDYMANEWVDIKVGSACLILSVNPQKITFTYAGRVYSIHNCYDDIEGIPVWCSIL